jgi:hypothetical protein
MAIDKKMETQVLEIMEKWCTKHNVTEMQLLELVDGLEVVKGNGSYEHTIASLGDQIDAHMNGGFPKKVRLHCDCQWDVDPAGFAAQCICCGADARTPCTHPKVERKLVPKTESLLESLAKKFPEFHH